MWNGGAFATRLAAIEDAPAINHIYNLAVAEKYCTAHTSPVPLEFHLQRLSPAFAEQFPVWVACNTEGTVIGWISLSAYRPGRQALQTTAEISYYVHPWWRRQGMARAMMALVISEAAKFGFSTLVAILLSPNRASICLLEQFGFKIWGCMPSIAIIEQKRYDHLYYGLPLV